MTIALCSKGDSHSTYTFTVAMALDYVADSPDLDTKARFELQLNPRTEIVQTHDLQELSAPAGFRFLDDQEVQQILQIRKFLKTGSGTLPWEISEGVLSALTPEERGEVEVFQAPIRQSLKPQRPQSFKPYSLRPGDIGQRLGILTRDLVSTENLPYVLVAAAATGVALQFDDQAQDFFRSKQPIGERAHLFNDYLAEGKTQLVLNSVALAVGELLDDRKLATASVAGFDAMILNTAVTYSLKLSVGRQRPGDSTDRFSFPSGHTSSIACLATTYSSIYDWDLKVTIPLYAVTVASGLSRIEANAHHLSDVVAGAALGALVGLTVADYYKSNDSAPITIEPYFQKGGMGIAFRGDF